MKGSTAVCILAIAMFHRVTLPGAETVKESRIASVESPLPEQVMWSPSGDAVWVSTVDEIAGVSRIGRYSVPPETNAAVALKGTIRAFWVGPNGDSMASIHEVRHNRLLQIWDLKYWTPTEIHRDTWNLYFPFVSTVTPWDASGERILFYKAYFHERKLCLWEGLAAGVRQIGEGRRMDRAFWGPEGDLLIPRGVTLQEALSGSGDPIRRFEQLDPASGDRRERPIPSGYSAFFPYVSIGMGILKEPSPPPLLVNLRTWETAPLPPTLNRFLEVAWAPSGEWLAYPVRGAGAHRIDTYSPKTGRSRLLWVSAAHQVGSLGCSPSGRYLACSVLKTENTSQEQIMVLDVASGDPVWTRNRDPGLTQIYHRRGRRSLLWHPMEDRLLFWDRMDAEGGTNQTEFRVVEIGG